MIQRASTSYAGCNYQHVRDLLAERDGIELSRTSVRRIRLSAGIGSPKKQRREDAAGSFLLVQQMLELHGRPLAFCHDRHGIFAQASKATVADTLEEQLVGKQDPTQFGRLVEELEITSIAARSPQAKGRVERLFGTLQERLVVHLRLAEASTLEQANQVLASASFALQRTVCGSACPGGQCLSSIARDAASRRSLLLQVSAYCVGR